MGGFILPKTLQWPAITALRIIVLFGKKFYFRQFAGIFLYFLEEAELIKILKYLHLDELSCTLKCVNKAFKLEVPQNQGNKY